MQPNKRINRGQNKVNCRIKPMVPLADKIVPDPEEQIAMEDKIGKVYIKMEHR